MALEMSNGLAFWEPYLDGLIVFLVAWLLVSDIGYNAILAMSHNRNWTAITIALILGALTFILVAIAKRRSLSIPQ